METENLKIMRMQAVLTIVLLAATPAVAQLPLSAPAPSGAEQPLVPAQRPPNDTFNGSGLVEKAVPGTLKLSILDAIDRGLRHNLGLLEGQDRYGAGVSGSLEVVQSQEAVADANETYIQALYLNNAAKLSLAHALGVAEQQTKSFLGGK